jgi:hypothetical protein
VHEYIPEILGFHPGKRPKLRNVAHTVAWMRKISLRRRATARTGIADRIEAVRDDQSVVPPAYMQVDSRIKGDADCGIEGVT